MNFYFIEFCVFCFEGGLLVIFDDCLDFIGFECLGSFMGFFVGRCVDVVFVDFDCGRGNGRFVVMKFIM